MSSNRYMFHFEATVMLKPELWESDGRKVTWKIRAYSFDDAVSACRDHFKDRIEGFIHLVQTEMPPEGAIFK